MEYMVIISALQSRAAGIASLAACLAFSVSVQAQMTASYDDPHVALTRGKELYESGLYHEAFHVYSKTLEQLRPVSDPDLDSEMQIAALWRAKSALRSEHPEAERIMVDFISAHKPGPEAIEGTMDLAGFYYNSKDYNKAVQYYGTLSSAELDAETLSEARFKEGYCYFIQKEFDKGETTLGEVKEIKSIYYYPVNYYYGMCQFFQDDLEGALASFQRVSKSDKYADHVPYYIAQIYFARGEYTEVIEYARPRMEYESVREKDEIALLLGRSYFETGEYDNALPHLKHYAQLEKPMQAEDFYQLAFVEYQAEEYNAAITHFQQIASEPNILGQRANYYLADCYIKTGDLTSAQTAFRNVSRVAFDTQLQEEALLQYGKVSAQLRQDAIAIDALEQIRSSSKYYLEAQETLVHMFRNTRDYTRVLKALESLPELNADLKKLYQEASLYKGMQLILVGQDDEAVAFLNNVETYPVNTSYTAQSLFWRADIAHRKKQYANSIAMLDRYFSMARGAIVLPVESSAPLASYMQGYNFLHSRNYTQAQAQFNATVERLKQEKGDYNNTILPDALVRAGDCAFKRNRYSEARNYYEDAIALNKYQVVYARYQLAMTFGLQRNPDEKIRVLEGIVRAYGSSDYVDDALLQLGITYHETGHSREAIAAFEELTTTCTGSPLYVPALLRLGLITYNEGETSRSLEYYKKVFGHHPDSDQAKEALSAIEEIYVSDLKTPDAYFTYVATIPGYEISTMKKDSVTYRVAEVAYEQADYAAAVKEFTDYLNKYPQGLHVIPAHFYRGDAHVLLTNYTPALEDFASVIEFGKSKYYSDALEKAAIISYNHAQDFHQAYQYYSMLSETTADSRKKLEADLGAIRSAYRAGMPDKVFVSQAGIQSNELATAEEKSEAAFYAGKALLDEKNYTEALPYFNTVASSVNQAQAAESRFRIAQIHYLTGDLVKAETQCHKANELNSNFPYWVAKSLILVSDIFVAKDDLFNAKAPLEAVIDNFQGDKIIVSEAREKLNDIKTREQQRSKVYRDTSSVLDLIEDHQQK